MTLPQRSGVSIKAIYRHKWRKIKRVRFWRIELAQPPFYYNYLTVKLYYKNTRIATKDAFNKRRISIT
jgi:hypothetical protein